jgi:2-polyprenyl-3-methyl-5-hydroxy-6-metoxy-1,4-benzoquinol methylase
VEPIDYSLLINEQIAYYKARAKEYDEWFFRQGRYDRGTNINQQWFMEIEKVRQALTAFKPEGQVLELACGTGIWTQQLLTYAEDITALDAVSEVLSINRDRTLSAKVRYVQADIFNWQPERKYDIVFFAFWLSHVPPERFEDFWNLVSLSLKPGGRVFLVDSIYDQTSTARDHHLPGSPATIVTRRLNNGSEFHIVKVFYATGTLVEKLRKNGWDFDIKETAHYFIYGQGQKTGNRAG